MPTCEMCGKKLNEVIDAIVEGTMLSVCQDCAKFGKVITIRKPVIEEEKIEFEQKVTEQSEENIITDYSEIIKKAREKLNLKQEELARNIAEKESVIHSIETGSLTPSIKLTKKLEQFLKIRLIIKPQKNQTQKEPIKKFNFRDRVLTIGDLIKANRDRNI